MITPEELLDLLKYSITTNEDRTTTYRFNGEAHRDEDQPSVIYADGTKAWYQNGLRHRDDDLPAIIHATGSKAWFVHGRFIKSEQS